MAANPTTTNEFSANIKKSICRELEAAIKLAIAESTLDENEKPLSSQITQQICAIVEALFIHGLRDAFFLRASRHSKNPIPNFWPFISKNTHRSIKQQILELGQIRTEVGKARAWIRIVLAENTLEQYLNLLTKDAQIRQFYDKFAFIRDPECVEILNKSLKALAQSQICAPINSSLLNNWTPTPLVMAGLIQGNTAPKVRPNLTPKNAPEIDEFAGIENEPEMGINAMDLLEPMGDQSDSALSLPFSPQSRGQADISSECSEDNESVLSHPSILEEFNNFYALGPSNKFANSGTKTRQQQFVPTILGILPDENIVEEEGAAQNIGGGRRPSFMEGGGPSVEYSSEVIVHRRKIGRRRAVSRSSCGSESNGSEIMGQNRDKNVEEVEDKEISEDGKIMEKCEIIVDEKPKKSEKIEIEQKEKIVEEPIPMGLSLQEELLLAERGEMPPQICAVPRITSDPQLNVGEKGRKAAEFTICSTDSSTNDLAQTFDEALREFLRRESVAQQMDKGENGGNGEEDGNGRQSESIASSSANLVHSPSTESSAGGLPPIEAINNKIPIQMEETTAICLLSPSGELPQIPFERDENAPAEEDENKLVEIMPFEKNGNKIGILGSTSAAMGNEQMKAMEAYSLPKRLLFLTKVPREMGLDAQNFRCKTCRRNIGVGFGAFRLCSLTGHYHCDFCMGNGQQESLIPARALLNGDFQKWPISSKSWALLRSIAGQPIFRVDFLNPRIYKFHKQLRKIRDLRRKLGLLVMYLLSCKNSIADDIKRRLWPHNHLHMDAHLYSISDLEGVADGTLERRLKGMCTFALGHIHHCALCIQKGFFCELCSSDRPIYPFQIETTYQCLQCSSCFHRECASKAGLIEGSNHQKTSSTSTNSNSNQPNCPKCLRRVKYSSAALNSLATTTNLTNPN